MKDAIQTKLATLEANLTVAVSRTQTLRAQLDDAGRTVLHIEGAIQVCRDLLAEVDAPPPAEPAKPGPAPEPSPI